MIVERGPRGSELLDPPDVVPGAERQEDVAGPIYIYIYIYILY